MSPNFVDRGKRFHQFYLRKGYPSKVAFVRIMRERGVRIYQSHVNRYFSGDLDPMNLAPGLISEGCDMNWIAAGDLSNEPDIDVTEEDKAMIRKLKKLGIDTLTKLEYVLNTQSLAQDVALVLRDRVAKYSPHKEKKK